MNLQRLIVTGLGALALAAPAAHAYSSPLHRWSPWTTTGAYNRYDVLPADHSKVLHICD